MSQLIQKLDEILLKIQKFTEICAILVEEKELLELENNQLRTQIIEMERNHTVLGKQLETLKISKKLEGHQSSSQDLKLKINEFIREIDQCILTLKKH